MAQTGATSRLLDQFGIPMDAADGIVVPAGQSGLVALGTDGANIRSLGVDATHHAWVGGKSAAGVAPTTNPVSVSGIDGGGLKRIFLLDAAGRPQENVAQWLGSTAPTVGQKIMAESLPVTMASNQSPIAVTVGLAPGALALPTLVNLIYDRSDGAIIANAWKEVLVYTIPAGFNGYVLRFSTFQQEAAASRLSARKMMGTLSIVTNAFVGGSTYLTPTFTANPQLVVTTALSGGGGGPVIVTLTYTNELGVAGRTGTFSIAKGVAAGGTAEFLFQAGDSGMQSIQAASAGTLLAAGAVRFDGFVQLAAHQDQSTTQQSQTLYSPGAVSFPTGTELTFQYYGGTVSKLRTLGMLLQLVAV